jgi:putative ABC transport system permease protein
MSTLAIWLSVVFVFIALFLSFWQKLGLEKDIAISTARCAVQLLAIGYVLQFVFHTNHPLLIFLLILMMIGVAAWNAAGRGRELKGMLWRIVVTLTAAELVTMGLLLGLGIVKATPQYVIPLSGMIIGSSMVVAGLFISQMKREVEASRGEIETLLCLGANKRQAIREVLKRAVKASMIPTFDTMKTIGLVQLPGTMTGMIIAGTNPIEAVRYQIMIMFSFSASAAISAIMVSMLSYKIWFTRDGKLK